MPQQRPKSKRFRGRGWSKVQSSELKFQVPELKSSSESLVTGLVRSGRSEGVRDLERELPEPERDGGDE